jgi:hypothetical protein
VGIPEKPNFYDADEAYRKVANSRVKIFPANAVLGISVPIMFLFIWGFYLSY